MPASCRSAAVEQLIQRLTALSFLRRAGRLGRYLGESESAANRATIRQLIEGLAQDGGARRVPFETFRERVERERFGVVITAHPTFSLARALQEVVVELALNQRRRPAHRTVTRGGSACSIGSAVASTVPISRSTWSRSIASPWPRSAICKPC